MRLLVIDDGLSTRPDLSDVLATRSDVESFDSAKDSTEALDKMSRNSYDAVVVDAELPTLPALLERIRATYSSIPVITIARGLEPDGRKAADLPTDKVVLEPFSGERIHKALDIVSRRATNGRSARLLQIMSQAGGLSLQQSTRIAIKSKGRIRLINLKDVVMVQAQGNYVLLQHDSGSSLLRESISVVAEKLRTYGFIRIHKSMLVNGSGVEEIYRLQTGVYGLRLKGGKELTVTRTYRNNLKSLAELWFDPFPGLCDRKNGCCSSDEDVQPDDQEQCWAPGRAANQG